MRISRPTNVGFIGVRPQSRPRTAVHCAGAQPSRRGINIPVDVLKERSFFFIQNI